MNNVYGTLLIFLSPCKREKTRDNFSPTGVGDAARLGADGGDCPSCAVRLTLIAKAIATGSEYFNALVTVLLLISLERGLVSAILIGGCEYDLGHHQRIGNGQFRRGGCVAAQRLRNGWVG